MTSETRHDAILGLMDGVVGAVLRELEWRHWSTRDGAERMCLICERDESRGHAPDCRMAAAIEAAGRGTPMASETHQDGRQTAAPAGVASEPTVDAAAVLASHTPRLSNYAMVRGDYWERSRCFVCAECGQSWGEDALTGGCDAVLVARRVALLEGLVRKMLSAFSEGEQWWRGHSGRCSEMCTDDHRCCALYAEVLAALADGG